MSSLKIMVLSSEYPNPNSSYDTPVVHYFVKEWIKAGHQVRVIHYRSVFPMIYYWIAKLFNRFSKYFFKTDFIPQKAIKEKVEYEIDGIHVISEPIFKLIPHGRYSNFELNKQTKKIVSWNSKNLFYPDLIIGHFYNPQLELLSRLKNYYPTSITSLVLHENPNVISKTFKNHAKIFIEKLNFIGFRFNKMRDDFILQYGFAEKTFICPSGIPNNYIQEFPNNDKFKTEFLNFCFTGMLIPLKNVNVILEALNLAFPNKDFTFKIIGKGMLELYLKKMVNDLNLANNVSFISHLNRDSVQNEMRMSDCFVMVSKPEAFGLVYLEAMGKGCITIGTKGQGIDGVIIDNYNGFLCEANNPIELANVFNRISLMSYDERMNIARNAIKTAKEMTDEKVAFKYLNTLVNLDK